MHIPSHHELARILMIIYYQVSDTALVLQAGAPGGYRPEFGGGGGGGGFGRGGGGGDQ